LDVDSNLEAIRAQAAQVAASGVLGRSRFYANLLEFLVTCVSQGRTPKELEIAAEVFGRGSEFDPSQDSMVRVYAHNLRQKLQQFYAEAGSAEPQQLTIPKGEYRLMLVDVEEPPEAPARRGYWQEEPRGLKLAAATVVLLGIGVALGMIVHSRLDARSIEPPSVYEAIAASPVWRPLLDDNLPILVVVGDYYIFGELDDQGNVDRLVREFAINSSKDLDDLLMYQPELAARYMDLDLTYLPRSAAFALRDVLRVLYTSDKSVRAISMSELDAGDFKTSHVVYVGYISALDKLLEFVFASSELAVGDTYDELIEKTTGTVYASEAGLPIAGSDYLDYGLFSTFPGPAGNQFLIVAGTRDAGLMQTAQALAEPMHLRAAEEAIAAQGPNDGAGVEILFEVRGFDRTNLDAMIVHTSALDYRAIWGGELLLAN
jgi:hypothetical protein